MNENFKRTLQAGLAGGFFLFGITTGVNGVKAYEAAPLTVVAMGDSTTAGTPEFFSPRERPPEGQGNPESQYAFWMMQRHPEWTVLNRGVRGQRSDQIRARFDFDVLQNKPQVLILLAGINDLYQGYPPEWIQENLQGMYDAAVRAGIRVMACTILPYDEATPAVLARMKTVNAWIREYAAEQGLGFCDTYAAVEDPFRSGKLLGTPDGLHPDIATYRVMGDAIGEALEKWLGAAA